MANVDRCASCGEIIPEGRQVCPICEASASKAKSKKGKSKMKNAKKTSTSRNASGEKCRDFVQDKICPVCKKKFIPAPQHVYRQNHDSHGRLVCSLQCASKETQKRGRKNGKDTI